METKKKEMTLQQAVAKLRAMFVGRSVCVQHEVFYFGCSGKQKEGWGASVFDAKNQHTCVISGACVSIDEAVETVIAKRLEADAADAAGNQEAENDGR